MIGLGGGKLALKGQQDLLIFLCSLVVPELSKGVLVLEGHDAVAAALILRTVLILHHRQNTVGVVLILLVGGDGEVQLRRGLFQGLAVRRGAGAGPLQLEVPAALGQLDVLRQGHVHHAVLDGDVLVGDVLNDRIVLAVDLEIPVAAVDKQAVIRHGDEQVPGALGVDDLGSHGGEADLGHVAVTAGQQDVCHALAQFFVLGDLTIVHAHGDALIGRLGAGPGLKVQGLGLALPHLQR